MSIKRDRATGKNLGYGFVKMSSHQEARGAKEAMQVRCSRWIAWRPDKSCMLFAPEDKKCFLTTEELLYSSLREAPTFSGICVNDSPVPFPLSCTLATLLWDTERAGVCGIR